MDSDVSGMVPDPKSLLDYSNITESDLQALERVREPAMRQTDVWLERLYRHLEATPQTRAVFAADPERIRRLREAHLKYLGSLFPPALDDAYMEMRRRIGQVHDQAGVGPWMLMGAWALLCQEMTSSLSQVPEVGLRAAEAVRKVEILDLSLILGEYVRTREEQLEARLREVRALNSFASTRLNELEEALTGQERHIRDYQMLAELARLNFQSVQGRDAVVSFLRALLECLDMHEGEVWVVDSLRDEVIQVAHEGLFPEETKAVLAMPLGRGLVGLAASRGEVQVVWDLRHYSGEVLRPLREVGLHFYVAVPLRSDSAGVIAVICLGATQPRAWGEGETALVENGGLVLGRGTLELLLDEFRRGGGGVGGSSDSSPPFAGVAEGSLHSNLTYLEPSGFARAYLWQRADDVPVLLLSEGL